MSTSSRFVVSLFTAALLFVLAAPARADAATPTILLLHGGGWMSGDPASMTPWQDELEALGYRTRIVAYPLGNVTRSIEYAEAIAQEERQAGGPVIAYGMSSGGTIAAALGATGSVDGAVNVSGPTDFTRWVSPLGIVVMLATHMSADEKRSASPYWRLNGQQTPQLIQCGMLDLVTTYDQCSRYAALAANGNPDTTLQTMVNLHGQWAGDRERARAWIHARWPAS